MSIYRTGRAVGESRSERARNAMIYLKANQHQLRQDLALGAGPVLDDLASAAEIRREHRAHFSRLLQRNRIELLELAHAEGLTPERALRALERVGELVIADPVLHADYQSWRTKNPELG